MRQMESRLDQDGPFDRRARPVRPWELCRSWLFVPGLDSDAQQAGLDSGADVLVADLEEFTLPADRPQARQQIQTLLGRCRDRGVVGAVRVNKLDGDGMDDIMGIMAGAPAAVLLPHAESAEQIIALSDAMSQQEAAHGVPPGSTAIVPTLESALGIVRTLSILSASQRTKACLLAAEDLSADLGAHRGPDGMELHAVRARFLVECIAAGVLPIDCPFNYRNAQAQGDDLAWARRLGFTSKCVVFAEQVAAVHGAFTPSHEDVALARERVERFEVQRKGQATSGELIDPPDYNTARRVLARHARFQDWTDGADQELSRRE